jgi:hypothetical protein
LNEAEKVMLVLIEALRTCLQTRTKHTNTNAIIAVIISIITKHRRSDSCLTQKMISLILYSGHCSKKVSVVTVVIHMNITDY